MTITNVQVQREQQRSLAEREATKCEAVATEYRGFCNLLTEYAGAARTSVAPIRRAIARELVATLTEAEQKATEAAARHRERQNMLTAAMNASATYRPSPPADLPPPQWPEGTTIECPPDVRADAR